MFQQYEPNVNVTILFLRLLKIKVTDATINQTLQNHPDWPSLLCISDSLNKWNVPNGAGKIDIDKIEELPVPFIASTHHNENPLVIVTEISSSTIKYYQKNYRKSVTESTDTFLKKWDGVYLIAEPSQHSKEVDYEKNKRIAFFNSLLPTVCIVALLLASFLLINKIIATAGLPSIAIYGQYFILISGAFVSSLLLWYEIDKNNPLLQKVCTGIAKGNCSAILTGKQSKIFSWLSWSEVGFFYFTGSALILLFATIFNAKAVGIIAWLNMLALPYTLFSIYYQWRVAKQWCVLCLAVQGLLLLGAINTISNNLLFPLPVLTSFLLGQCLLFSAIPILLWYIVKPYLIRLQEAKNTKREYLRIKFNTEIFDTLLKKQKKLIISTDGLGIDLGNPAAINTIIKVCNPYCGPCAKAHEKIEALLENNANVKLKIIFNTSNKETDPAIKPTRHLMAIAEKNIDQKQLKQSLDDWYLPKTKKYDQFAAKYPMNGELMHQGVKIEAMEKWYKEAKITYTPTIFINGYQLPDAYTVEDLQHFLLA